MEMYYDKEEKYLQSSSMPDEINDYLPDVPRDPKTGDPYEWIDNTGEGEDQKYCTWAELEAQDKYFCASHRGTKLRDSEPTNLDDCF